MLFHPLFNVLSNFHQCSYYSTFIWKKQTLFYPGSHWFKQKSHCFLRSQQAGQHTFQTISGNHTLSLLLSRKNIIIQFYASCIRHWDSGHTVTVHFIHGNRQKFIPHCLWQWNSERTRPKTFAAVNRVYSSSFGNTYILPFKGSGTDALTRFRDFLFYSQSL